MTVALHWIHPRKPGKWLSACATRCAHCAVPAVRRQGKDLDGARRHDPLCAAGWLRRPLPPC